jgi:hypothetical protein
MWKESSATLTIFDTAIHPLRPWQTKTYFPLFPLVVEVVEPVLASAMMSVLLLVVVTIHIITVRASGSGAIQ